MGHHVATVILNLKHFEFFVSDKPLNRMNKNKIVCILRFYLSNPTTFISISFMVFFKKIRENSVFLATPVD